MFELATKAADAARIHADGKRIVFMSIENAYPLGEDPTMLKLFYQMGVRETGFAHFRNNQYADSSTDPDGPKWHGLSPLGFKLLAEANKLGVIVDGSHSSDAVLDQLIQNSTRRWCSPTQAARRCTTTRAMSMIPGSKRWPQKAGSSRSTAMAVTLRAAKPNPGRQAAMGKLFASMHENAKMTAAQYQDLLAKRRAIDAQFPETDPPTFDDFMKHLLHALKVVGPDHVGIGMDWDGGGGVVGLEDSANCPASPQRF